MDVWSLEADFIPFDFSHENETFHMHGEFYPSHNFSIHFKKYFLYSFQQDAWIREIPYYTSAHFLTNIALSDQVTFLLRDCLAYKKQILWKS